MGPPKSRSILLLMALLLLAGLVFFQSNTLITTQQPLRPRLTERHLSAGPVGVALQSTATPGPRRTITAPPGPRRTITMHCAKAGPHWRRDLPTTATSAVELVPYPFSTDGGTNNGPLPRRRRLEPFEPLAVALHNHTHIFSATVTNLRYMLALEPDDLLFAWRRQAGISQPWGARGLRGWESPGSELRGHVLGHWLSAVALSIAARRDEKLLRARLTRVLSTLETC